MQADHVDNVLIQPIVRLRSSIKLEIQLALS